ncbi:MAG: DNA-directed RNA polymerase subunit H [Candidatus Micrarchaeota archaeon]
MDPNFSHSFLPKHTIASEDEVDEVLKKYSITKENLPILKSDDPAAKAMNAKAGDVIRIVRILSDGKEALYWRVVVD